jgi:hypothetical protein
MMRAGVEMNVPGRRVAPALVALVTLVVIAATACSTGSAAQVQKSQGVTSSPLVTASTPPVASLVGRWEQVHHCSDLVNALDKAGLAATAPAAVGDFFPGASAQRLAGKSDICAGAKPFRHYHFFRADGQFGSLDQDLNQVDDGQYTIVSDHTFRIGSSTFQYTIRNGDTLTLQPLITPAERRKALAHPLRFSTAAWMEAVAYRGTTWNRVACDSWC